MKHLSMLLVLLVVTVLAPREAHAVYKFCINIDPVYVDSGVGEDYLTGGPVPAYRHKMILYRNDVQVATGPADSNGCIPGTYSTAGIYKLSTFPKLNYGTGTTPVIAVYKDDTSGGTTGIVSTWPSLPSSTGAAVITKTITVTGVALAGVFRVSAALTLVAANSLDSAASYTVRAEVPHPAICVACVIGTEMVLSEVNGTWINQWKSSIAHEMGHLVQLGLFGGSFGQAGLTNPGDNKYCATVSTAPAIDTCRCDEVATSDGSGLCSNEQWDRLHCLNSREYMFAAFNEGWGHFYGSAMLNANNSNAIFPYYKELIRHTGSVAPPPVSHTVLPSTPYRWMETECSDVTNLRGTEMDWLSFFFHLRTQTSDAFSYADFKTLFTSPQVCGTLMPSATGLCSLSDEVTWEDMDDGAAAQTGWSLNKRNFFRNNGATFGVDH